MSSCCHVAWRRSDLQKIARDADGTGPGLSRELPFGVSACSQRRRAQLAGEACRRRALVASNFAAARPARPPTVNCCQRRALGPAQLVESGSDGGFFCLRASKLPEASRARWQEQRVSRAKRGRTRRLKRTQRSNAAVQRTWARTVHARRRVSRRSPLAARRGAALARPASRLSCGTSRRTEPRGGGVVYQRPRRASAIVRRAGTCALVEGHRSQTSQRAHTAGAVRLTAAPPAVRAVAAAIGPAQALLSYRPGGWPGRPRWNAQERPPEPPNDPPLGFRLQHHPVLAATHCRCASPATAPLCSPTLRQTPSRSRLPRCLSRPRRPTLHACLVT
jgi:hypothetical protein